MTHQLVVIGYDDEHKAEEIRLKLVKMQREYLIDLEDAVVAVKKPNGKVRLNQAMNLPLMGATQGSFLGLLVGLLFMMPLFGVIAGTATGALTCAISDLGINDDFMKQVASHLEPGKSALFVLIRQATPDKVLEELQGTGGKIIQTSLTHEDEAKLQAVLDKARTQPVA